MIVERARIESLVPQKGAMCLIDRIEYWDGQRIICSSMQHRSPGNPLRARGILSSLHAIEFAAQVVAVHGGLMAVDKARQRTGLLLSARDCRFIRSRLDDIEGPLAIEAGQIGDNGETLLYRFRVSAQDVLVAEGRIAVVLEGEAQP
ncbi:MAG TPA: 3-hydroxylacyl-ACP dehydratase [Casimicrobiaceae bacterium]